MADHAPVAAEVGDQRMAELVHAHRRDPTSGDEHHREDRDARRHNI
ncbi:MAG TPA: hypothetical protein VIO16_02755 [Dehalococcoidia bacterium]